jgi:uncharacterized protein (DUF427 family)
MAKAIWKGIVLADSDDIVLVEGNVYFPRADVDWGYIQLSDELPLTYCHWKGMAEYYDIFVGEKPNDGAAWAYVEPYLEADAIAGRVAFWHGVEVTGAPDGEGQIEKQPSQQVDKSGWQSLCWYLKFTNKDHLDTTDIEVNTGIGEAALAEIWNDYNVQRYAQHYGWKMSLRVERT